MKSLVFSDQLNDFTFAQLVEKVKLHRVHYHAMIPGFTPWMSQLLTMYQHSDRLDEHCSFGDMLEDLAGVIISKGSSTSFLVQLADDSGIQHPI